MADSDALELPFKMTEADFRLDEIGRVWHGMDLDTMGRVLRAHLVVEYFICEMLAAKGHNLKQLEAANIKVGFYQKLQLLYPTEGKGKRKRKTRTIRDGIEQLNTIRNKFAHSPTHTLNKVEAEKLAELAGEHFASYFEGYCAARHIESALPIDTIEAFAEWAAFMLQVSARGIERLHAENAKIARERIAMEVRGSLLAELDAHDINEPSA